MPNDTPTPAPEQRLLDLLKRLIVKHPDASEEEIKFLFIEQGPPDDEDLHKFMFKEVHELLYANAQAVRRDGTGVGPITVEELLADLRVRQTAPRAKH